MHSRSGSRWITRQGIAAAPVQLPDAGSALSLCIILLAVRAEVSSLQNVAVYERGDATKVMCIQADNAKGCGGIVSVQELGSEEVITMAKQAHMDAAKLHTDAAGQHITAASKHDAGHHDDALKQSEQAHASSTAAHDKSTDAKGKSIAAAKK